MARAQFHSIRGKKQTSCLLMVRTNALEIAMHPVYASLKGASHFAGKDLTDDDQGFEFEIPDGFKRVQMHNEDGEPFLTEKTKEPLYQISYE